MEGWVEKTLGEVCTLKSGSTVKKNLERSSGDIPYLKVADMTLAGNEKQIVISSRFLNSDDIRKTAIFPVGTTIFPKRGGAILTNKKRLTAVPICTDLNIMGVIPSSVLLPDYLYFYFLNVDMSVLGSGSSIPQINNYDIAPLVISYPPLPEQERIVAILDEAFAAIATATANAEKNLANARELFESYVNGVFENADADWDHGTFADFVSEIATGPFGSLLHKSDYVEDGIPVINPMNIVGGVIVAKSSKTIGPETYKRLEKYIVHDGDIVVARRGEIGRCAVVGQDEDGWLCGTGSFVIRPSKKGNTRFLTYLLRSAPYREKLERVSGGATTSNLSNKNLSGLDVRIPPVPMQQKFLLRFDELAMQRQQLVEIYERKLDLLAELKQSILHKAFSGELTADAKAVDHTLSEAGL